MLQLIVLGLIPGTHLQITYAWVVGLLVVIGFVVWGIEIIRVKSRQRAKASLIDATI